MRQPIHLISASASRLTPERIGAVGFVGALHVIVIWAIVTGLVPKIVRAVVPPDIVLTFPDTPKSPPPPAAPAMPHVDLPTAPAEIVVPPPQFTIQQDTMPRTDASTTTQTPPSLPDMGASGIADTHTTPDYPPVARKLGEQGTVKLRLTISAQGIVTAADIAQSSGFPDLDQTAVDWVLAHWKYKPAMQGGGAVQSTALAAVVFNLKNFR